MEDIELHIANYFFYLFHTTLIVFNLLGWAHYKTRRLNLITLIATFTSWGLLGIWKGWGYCFLTDWHYRILRRLGEVDLPSSYIAFLVERLTGWLPGTALVNTLTLSLTLLAFGCSLWTNFRPRK